MRPEGGYLDLMNLMREDSRRMVLRRDRVKSEIPDDTVRTHLILPGFNNIEEGESADD
jgi:hypothetical protein